MTGPARGEGTAPALIEAESGRSLTYAELDRETGSFPVGSEDRKALIFHFAANTLGSAVTFLAARRRGHAVALLDPTLKPELVARLIELYEPHLVTGRAALGHRSYAEEGPGVWRRTSPSRAAPHPDLSVLLSTSGSTGSPKLVRLSSTGIEHNALAIAESLGLTPADRAFAALPLHYSYGMSVLTSHLAVGGCVVISDASVIEPRFWEQFTTHEATSLSGVPYTYQMLLRTGFLERELPSLRSMTQAGGRLPSSTAAAFHSALAPRGVRFYVMYGQTEASPRMSCLGPEDLVRKLGSVGRALPGGSFTIESRPDAQPLAPGVEGEVVYRGPNVMMGYATDAADLAGGDETDSTLHTGDLGHLDDDGFLFITGRSKRIAKVFGVRLSLDEVEAMIAGLGAHAVVGDNDRLLTYHEGGDEAEVRSVRKRLAMDLKVPTQALVFRQIDRLPVLPSGKPDYQALVTQAGAS